MDPRSALPGPLRRTLRRGAVRVRFGSLRRTAPLSAWGGDRGGALDRWYIERWLDAQRRYVRGAVVEVKSDLYATWLGAERVDILDIDPDNDRATIVGDLCAVGTLATGAYDGAIVTQTLQLLEDPAAALRHLVAALRPGGSLLVTVPSLSRAVDLDADRWRWTAAGLRTLLATAAPQGAELEVSGHGNATAGRAFLFGLGLDDVPPDLLAVDDPLYPLVASGRLTLPAEGSDGSSDSRTASR